MQTLEHPEILHDQPTAYGQVAHGPLLEAGMLTAGLDYYKPTMSQVQHEKYPEAEVTFTFTNRSDKLLTEYVKPEDLQARLDMLRVRGWSAGEVEYLRSLKNSADQQVFSDDYLTYLVSNELPAVQVRVNKDSNDLAIDTNGAWPMVTFWETIVMSEVNEAYFEGLVEAQGIDLLELYAEGDRRLDEKIAYFQANPGIKFADFGTRRRFSLRWHEHVVGRLATECPDNFVGTSNVALAAKLDIKPIGTFAHEMPMVYAAIADATGQDIRASHGQMLDDWYEKYGDDLSVMLSDTFGSDFFFESLTQEQAVKFKSTRQDSGDPIAYGEKAISAYNNLGIDPQTKSVTFSDNLNIEKVDRIHRAFRGRLGHLFGIGTYFSNDLGIKAGNNVMKATRVRIAETNQQATTVKLSDDPGKHTGQPEQIARYQTIFRAK